MKPRRNLFLGSVLVLALSQVAHAADYYWNTTTTASWGTGANWSDNATSGGTTGVVPLAADSVFFDQSAVNGGEIITLDADRAITGITFNNTGTTTFRANASGTTARKLTLGTGGITIASTAGNVTFIDTPGTYGILTIDTGTTTQTWTNNATTLTAGPVTGSGQLTLTGANASGNSLGQFALDLSAYTGNLILNNARLANSAATNGFGTTGTILVNSGAQLIVNTANTTNSRAVTINGNGWYDATVQRGAIRFLQNGDFSSTVTLGSSSMVMADSGRTGTFSGKITGGNALTIGNSAGGTNGTITFSGGTANDYSGLTTVSAGTLNLNKTAAVNAIAGNVLVTNVGTLSNTTDNQIANTATVSVDTSSAVWTLNAKTETIDTLNLSGAYTASKGFVSGVAGKLTVTNLNVSGGGVTLNSAGAGLQSTITATTVTNTGGTWVFGTASGTQSLVIGSGGLTIGGGSTMAVASAATATTFISLGGNVTSQAHATTANTISTSGTNAGELRLNATRTFNVADGAVASDLTISAIVADGAGTGAIIKTGAGNMTLSGVNTYTGGTQIDTGTLTLGHATTTLANAGSVNVNGGILALGTNTDTVGAVTLTSGSITGSGTGTLTGSSYDVRSGSISAKLAGAGVALTKSTGGTVTLSGANTYTGGTTISAGTLSVGATENLGTSASGLTFDGGVLQITGTALANISGIGHTVALNAGKTVGLDINNSAHTFTMDQALNQTTGGFTKLGAGTAILNQTNTYTGDTTISAGTLSVATDSNLGDGTAVSLGGGTLQITGGSAFSTSKNVTLTANSGIYVTNAAGATIGTLTGGFQLAKTGAGKLTTGGAANSIKALVLANELDLGNGALTINNAGATTIANTADATISASGSGTLSLTQASATDGGNVGTANGTTLTISAPIIGSNSFESYNSNNGTGVVVLSGINTYSGDNIINSGVVSVANIGNQGSLTSNLGSGTTIHIGNSSTTTGTLLYNGAAATTDRIINLRGTTAGATIEQAGASGLLEFTTDFTATGNGAKTLTLTGSTAGTGKISGKIVNSTSATSLAKSGTGTWTLSGANTYTGATTISGGTLSIGANANLGAVATGATLNLSGGTLQATSSFALDNAGANKRLVVLTNANTIDTVANTLTLSGVMSSTGSLTKVGSGTLSLTGANTFTGALIIKEGTLQANNPTAITTSASLTLGDATGVSTTPATLDATGGVPSYTYTKAINVVGTNQVNTIKDTTYTQSYSGPITLTNANLTLNQATSAAQLFSGGITGTGNLIIGSTGTGGSVTIQTAAVNNTGTISNTGSGTATTSITGGIGSNVTAITQNSTASSLTISTGALTVNSGGTTLTNTAGTKLLTVSGGVIGTGDLILDNDSATAAGITLSTTAVNNNGKVINSGSGNGGTTISSIIDTNVTEVVQNSATSALILSGPNTYTSATTISAGTLSAGNIVVSGGSSNLGNTASVVTLGSAGAQGILSYTGNTANYIRGFSIGGAGGGRLNVTTAAQTLTVGTVGISGTGLFTVGGAGNTSITSALTHNGGLTKADAGILVLSGPNTHSGGTTLTAGTTQIGVGNVGSVGSITSSALGTGTLTFNGGALSSDGTTPRIILNAVTFTGNAFLGNVTNNGKLTFSADGNIGTTQKTMTVNSDAQFDGILSGTGGGITLGTSTGYGKLTLTNTTNSFTGNVSLGANSGTLRITSSGALGIGPKTVTNAGASGSVPVTGANLLELDSNGGTDITLASDITFITSGAAGVVLNTAGNNTINGTFSLTSGNGASKIISNGGALNLAGDISIISAAGGARTLDLDGTSTGANTVGGAISNGGGFVMSVAKNGMGTWGLSGGTANIHTGLTTVNGGLLLLDKSGAVNAIAGGGLTIGVTTGNTAAAVQYTGASSDMMGTGAVTINGRGILDFNGKTDTIGNVAIVSTGATTSNPTPITNTAGGGNLTIGTLGITPVAGFTSVVDSGTGTLTLGGNVAFTAATTGRVQVGGNLDLGSATRTFTVGLGTGADYDMLVDALVSSSAGSFGLTKAGAGRLMLSNANTYTGGTSVTGGRLVAADTAAMGAAGQIVTLNGSTLEFATNASANAYVLNMGSDSAAATVVVNRATSGTDMTHTMGTATLGKAITLNVQKGANVSGTGTLALNGLILSAGSAGTTILNPTTANMTIGAVSGLGTANAKTLQLDGTSTGNLISGIVSNGTANPLSLTKANTGTWLLGNANSYTGATSVTGGILAIGNKDALSGTSSITVGTTSASTTSLRIDVSDATTGAGKSVTIYGMGASNSGALQGAASTDVTWAGDVSLAAGMVSRIGGGVSGSLTVSGVISGADADAGVLFSRAANSTTILSNVNTYAGETQLYPGGSTVTLKMGIANAINSGSRVMIGSATTGTAYFDLNGYNQNIRSLSDTVTGDLVVTNNSLTGDAELKLSVTTTDNFGGWIQDGATKKTSLVVAGAGTQILSGVNTYSGGTTVTTGTLTLGHATNTLRDDGAVNVNGGILALGANNDTVGAVTLTGGSITGTSGALTGSGSNFDVRSGTVSAKLGGIVGLDKSTTGSVTLSGTNTYTGTTTVSAGMLTVSGTGSLDAGSAVTVEDLATLSVAGIINGALTVDDGGTLTGSGGTFNSSVTINGIHSPGASPGIQTFTSGLIYNSSAVLNAEFVGNTLGLRGTDFDGVDVIGGDLSIDSLATFNLLTSSIDYTLAAWDISRDFTVIDHSGAGTSTGFFVLNTSGAGSFASEGTWSLANTGGDVVLSWAPIPEPRAALLGGLGMLVLLRRRRK